MAAAQQVARQQCLGDRHALPSTLGSSLEGAFRTPTLRCVGAYPSYLHTGQLATLKQVVGFFDRGGDHAGAYPGVNELTPLGLSDQEKTDLVAFLGALEGAGRAAALLADAVSGTSSYRLSVTGADLVLDHPTATL